MRARFTRTLVIGLIGGIGAAVSAQDFLFGPIEEIEIDGPPYGISIIEAADFDLDGDQDLVGSYHVNYWDTEGLPLLENDADGNFAVTGFLPLFEYPANGGGLPELTTADIDNNGYPDLVTAGDFYPYGSGWEHLIAVWSNNSGQLVPSKSWSLPGYPTGLAHHDFRGLGSDLYTLHPSLHVRINEGDGQFEQSHGYSDIRDGNSVHFCDLDQDGQSELLVGGSEFVRTYSLVGFDQLGVPEFGEPNEYQFSVNARRLWTGDLNGDDYPDVVAHGGTGSNRTRIATFMNNGDGTLGERTDYSWGSDTSGSSDHIDAADFDCDGDLDVLVSGMYNPRDPEWSYFLILENDGSGNLADPFPVWTGDRFHPGEALAVDVDNDGDMDLVGGSNGSIVVRRNLVNCTRLEVNPDPLIAGQDGTFSAFGMTPNANTYLAYSVHGEGSTSVPPLNITLDLKKPKQAGPTLMTDGDGFVEWVLHLPPFANPIPIWFQVVQFENKTDVVETTIEP